MAITLTPALAAEYERLYFTMRITRGSEIDRAARRIIAMRPLFMRVAARCGVPWEWAAAILYRESGLRTDKHYHNGDALTGRTWRIPKGRLPGKAPPYSFEESAYDALCVLKGLHRVRDWSVARMCFEAERYNGFGYRRMGRVSPYVWAGSHHYTRGKYVADHKFDAGHVDRQLGVIPIIKRVRELSGDVGGAVSIPSPGDLVDAARDEDKKAEKSRTNSTATGAGSVATGTGGATVDQVAGVDWLVIGLWVGAAVLIGLAIWYAVRSGLHRKAADALRLAARNVDAWARERIKLPEQVEEIINWTQVAK